jgi:hypothetical protein
MSSRPELASAKDNIRMNHGKNGNAEAGDKQLAGRSVPGGRRSLPRVPAASLAANVGRRAVTASRFALRQRPASAKSAGKAVPRNPASTIPQWEMDACAAALAGQDLTLVKKPREPICNDPTGLKWPVRPPIVSVMYLAARPVAESTHRS